MKRPIPVRTAYQVISFLAVIAGLLGMGASALFLGSKNFAAIAAGASGFLAGAVLVGSGLIATALLQMDARRIGTAAR